MRDVDTCCRANNKARIARVGGKNGISTLLDGKRWIYALAPSAYSTQGVQQ